MFHRILWVGLTMLWLPESSVLAMAGGEGTAAEEPSQLTVGSRLRLTLEEPASEPLIGQVVALEPDIVVLRREDGGPETRVPLTPSTTVEVSAGERSQAARGAMVGAAVGAMPGLLLTFGDYNTEKGSPALISIAGAAAGAAIGALIGSALKSEDWRPAKVPVVTAGIAPIPRGAAISVRVVWGRGAPTHPKE